MVTINLKLFIDFLVTILVAVYAVLIMLRLIIFGNEEKRYLRIIRLFSTFFIVMIKIFQSSSKYIITLWIIMLICTALDLGKHIGQNS